MQTINWKWLNKLHRLDVQTFLAVNASPYHCSWSRLARHLSRTGDGWLYPLIPLLIWCFIPPMAGACGLALGIALVVERILYLILKNGCKRSRPPQAIPGFRSLVTASDEFSFPSGHTSGAFLVATVCCYALGPMFSVLYAWAGLVGMSRVVLGVHFPTDILAGAAMGSLVGLAASRLVFGY